MRAIGAMLLWILERAAPWIDAALDYLPANRAADRRAKKVEAARRTIRAAAQEQGKRSGCGPTKRELEEVVEQRLKLWRELTQ